MTSPPDPGEQRRATRNLARRAMFDLARAAGARPVNRPAFRGSHATVPDVDRSPGSPPAGDSKSPHANTPPLISEPPAKPAARGKTSAPRSAWSPAPMPSKRVTPPPRPRSPTPPDTPTLKPPAATAARSTGAAAPATRPSATTDSSPALPKTNKATPRTAPGTPPLWKPGRPNGTPSEPTGKPANKFCGTQNPCPKVGSLPWGWLQSFKTTPVRSFRPLIWHANTPPIMSERQLASYPQYNLELAGWRRQSVWGWDPA